MKKKKRKKKLVQNLDGYCPLSMRLGAGLGAGLAWAQAGVQGAGRWAQARVAGVRTGAGVRGPTQTGAGVRKACMRWQARGRTSERSARGVGSRQRAAGRAGRAAGRHAGARQARGARLAGRPGHSLCAQAGPAGPGWGFVHSDSVFLARFDSVVS